MSSCKGARGGTPLANAVSLAIAEPRASALRFGIQLASLQIRCKLGVPQCAKKSYASARQR